MSSFPPKRWNVRYLKDMASLSCEPSDDNEVSMEAFMAVRPSSGQEGNFRFTLAGPSKLPIQFDVSDLLKSDLFRDMTVEAELDIADNIRMELNLVCSEWVDIVELVRSQDISIVGKKREDRVDEFLTSIDSLKKDLMEETGRTEKAGICLRWVLGTVMNTEQQGGYPDGPGKIIQYCTRRLEHTVHYSTYFVTEK